MTKDDVIALFEEWNGALATLDPDTVTAMYAADAVLLPTVSNQVRHNHAEIRDYFKQMKFFALCLDLKDCIFQLPFHLFLIH